MSILKYAKNPYVLGGAALLGVLIVVGSKMSAPATTNLSQPVDYSAGIAFAAQNAAIAGSLQTHVIDTTLTEHLKVLDLLNNMFQVQATVGAQNATVAAGVAQTEIQAATSRAVEANDNATRLAMSWLSADVSKTGIDANVAEARIASDTARAYQTGATVASATQSNDAAAASGQSALVSLVSKFLPIGKAA